MTAAAQLRNRLTLEEYLEGEELSDVRHDYLAGELFPVENATGNHNRVAGNLFARLHVHLAGTACEPFMNNMKLVMRGQLDDFAYYPDIMVACDPSDNHRLYRERPTVLAEVESPSTSRNDQREKYYAFRELPSLEDYLTLSQDKIGGRIARRSNSWLWEVLGENDHLSLPSLNFSVPLRDLYDRVEF